MAYEDDGKAEVAPQTANARRSAGRKRTFLDAYRRNGSVIRSAVEAGVTDRMVRKWRERDPKFAAAMEAAEEHRRTKLIETSERELARRALLGRREPVFQNGKLVGYRRRYSDRLLLRQLEAEAPNKWGRRSVVDHRIQGLVNPQLQARLADPATLEEACSRDALVADHRPRGLPSPDLDIIDVESVAPADDPEPRATQDNLS